MTNKLKMLTLAGALAVGASSMAMAQCPPGYGWNGVACQPAGAYAPNNPVSGAASGASSGAAAGNAAAGPIGAVVGGALGTATGTIAGTTNMVTGAPVATTGGVPAQGTCAPGYVLHSGGCYPAR